MRTKDEAANVETYKQLALMIPDGKVGVISKESPNGRLVTEWKDSLKANSITLDTADVSVGLSILFAPKDLDEMVSLFLNLGCY